MYRVFPRLVLSPTFWILTLLIMTICLIPTYAIVIYQNSRPSRLRGQLENREDSISEVIYSAAERVSIASPVLPVSIQKYPEYFMMHCYFKHSIFISIFQNRRSSTVVPWRGNFSCYDNKAF